ncbi:MAG: hypothetical protein GTO45_13695 [Candidatus Aminicenantes bacterium]|nr:hypothetical protein [Candidatus Aminicenantes bacterium]NIM79829.1 hypothetical protein [Candidatus Aminicenantes bacterium]NIN19159.1 hypothetical protein [Candidatus Aminicenantes bacterium]NIN43063.1 hypothetical protein [Candidatus Aminicenantes bacterium]NIN85804.1 hypothetical protein [Candidatus Aminicenantes bacterium]
MDNLYDILKFIHIISFVFMATPLFNLIVVNERALMGKGFVYATDRYMENIIRRGAIRCYVFQSSVLVTGILLLFFGPLGIEALWQNWVVLLKTLLLIVLMGLLSYVHFVLQPKIEALMAEVKPDVPAPENLSTRLKPYRVRRKKLASFCLFIVISIIILGVQVYDVFSPIVTIGLIVIAALFAWRANKTLIRFGWF